MNGPDHITQEPNKGSTGLFPRKESFERISEPTCSLHLKILDENLNTCVRKFKNSQLRKNLPKDLIISQPTHSTTLTEGQNLKSDNARSQDKSDRPGSPAEVRDCKANDKTSWEVGPFARNLITHT